MMQFITVCGQLLKTMFAGNQQQPAEPLRL